MLAISLLLGALAAVDAGAADAGAAPAPRPMDLRWSRQTAPVGGPAKAIGGYAGGCLQGGVSLAPSGPGWDVVRLGRRRHFGHPQLVAFLQRLGREVRKRKLEPLLIGDLAQPRGGPTPSGHRSHQTGLDVDIGYVRPAPLAKRALRAAEREVTSPPPVVDLVKRALTTTWRTKVIEVLALAAQDAAVDRVFVNPVIKRTLCESHRGQPWLGRVRPWWGHHDHFHVRLRCPADSETCEPSEPLPAGDGCGRELAWWFSDEPARALGKRNEAAAATGAPLLPAACEALVR